MQTIHLDLGPKSYAIHIGSGLLTESGLLTPHIQGKQVFVVTNEVIASHYLDRLKSALGNLQVDVHVMPEGEAHKTLATMQDIAGGLLAAGHNRSTTMIALGGGVVGDTAGFAAASYQRGVDFIQIPTTLLSQVDSSVGGKTAVNHELGKNMIGAFHQPNVVIIDTETLKTLPKRELVAGLAEVIKHGVLGSSEYFDLIEASLPDLLALNEAALTEAIKGSCEIKAAIVAEDEKEAGKRALLNFGHTFAHAIEAGMGYGDWLHGEAVGTGMVMAADLSMRMGRCSATDAKRIKEVVASAGLPIVPPESMQTDEFVKLMAKDKKATDAGMRFILLQGAIGKTEVVSDVPLDVLKKTLTARELLCC